MEEDRKAFFAQMMENEWRLKLERFRRLNKNVKKGQILFTGSSLMENFPVNELLMTNGMPQIIYNRGIGGFQTTNMLEHMEEQIFGTEPAKIFINIGTNDFNDKSYTVEALMDRYEQILTQVRERLPKAEVYLMAYYPVNEEMPQPEGFQDAFAIRNNYNLQIANKAVEELAAKMGYHFINVNDGLYDENGKLKKELTIEGVHMHPEAYEIIFNNMKPYL